MDKSAPIVGTVGASCYATNGIYRYPGDQWGDGLIIDSSSITHTPELNLTGSAASTIKQEKSDCHTLLQSNLNTIVN
jgi:hypothetical protein